jgi:hypothetical protein
MAAPSTVSIAERVRLFRHRHEQAEHLTFFAGGFTFDALMVTRIDDAPVLIQQGAYLAVVGLLMAGLLAWDHRGLEPPRRLRWLWHWSVPALHFMLGTLLNAYALFYVKSASGLVAVLAVIVISALLLINELPQLRRFGPVVLYGLYSFCLTSYFAYLYPVLFGRLRAWMFVLAVASSLLPLLVLSHFHHRVTAQGRRVLRQALAPSLGVQAALLLLFALHLIPPVPLSLLHIGIYHDVARDPAAGNYRLRHQPSSWWRVWADDDQDFHARHGDRVYCFVRIFAPRAFRDEVRVRWARREAGRGWVGSDAVPITIVGGREQGFGGFTYKANWSRGDWRVTVETADGREIGRRLFTIRDDVPPDQTIPLIVTTR